MPEDRRRGEQSPSGAIGRADAGEVHGTVDVTLVVVAHDGERWLPDVLAALGALTVRPRRTIAVDTGSTDATAALLAAATGQCLDRVLTAGRRIGYGEAVATALTAEPDAPGGPSRWLWLLHDDSAPAADALERLLAAAADSPSTALLGPKALDWDDPRVLVEVGLTTDRAGHRETGLERREYDQGQHDAERDVLAVGTAGALVRRDVWDAVGGLDPALPVFRDDLDLGWRVNAAGHRVAVVPAATVRHARAATVGVRRLHAVRGRPDAVDRRHALLVLVAHASTGRLPLLVLRLLLATALRSLGLLLTRQPAQALDELAAAGALLLHPGRVRAARRFRAGSRTVTAGALRPLFASPTARARARVEAAREWLTGEEPTGGLAALEPTGASRRPEAAADPRRSPLRRLLTAPSLLLVLALLAVALVAERSVLSVHGGVLAGGRLLGAPGGARDLWAAYAASWHPASVGSSAPAPPSLAVLAVLATVLLGKAWLAVDLLLLGSIPLAGATAYAAAGALVRSTRLRLWAGATWALLPVATGAVAAGRLDAAAAQIGLPLLLLAGGALLRDDPGEGGWRRAWAAGLGLAVLCAFAPTLWPLLAALLLGGALVGLARGPRGLGLRRLGAAAIAAGVPVVLLLPWSLRLVRPAGAGWTWDALLAGPGRQARDSALAEVALPGWHLVLLSPGGAGLPPVWLCAGLLLAALAGVLRGHPGGADPRGADPRGEGSGGAGLGGADPGGRAAGARGPGVDGRALAGWALALPGLASALLLARVHAQDAGSGSLPIWPGTALQVTAAGLLVAALAAADGARARLAAADFGARQLAAGLVALLAAAVPVGAAASYVVRGAAGPLERGAPDALPAFVHAELAGQPGLRVLLLRPGSAGAVAYRLVGARGARLGDVDTPPTRHQARALDAVVADLLTPRGSDAAAALATRSVRYVGLPADRTGRADGALVAALDAQPGLARRAQDRVVLWEVTGPSAPLTLLEPRQATAALRGARAPAADLLPGDAARPLTGSSPTVPVGPAGRLLVLGQATDPGWTATLDGHALPRRTAWGWATAFTLPAQGGTLEVHHAQGGRRRVLLLQALGLLVVAVLAGPGGAVRRGLEHEPRHRRGRRAA